MSEPLDHLAIPRHELSVEARLDLEVMCLRDGGHDMYYRPECAMDYCRKCGASGE